MEKLSDEKNSEFIFGFYIRTGTNYSVDSANLCKIKRYNESGWVSAVGKLFAEVIVNLLIEQIHFCWRC